MAPSGMPTRLKATLNRTIVGWKQRSSVGQPAASRTFKSHHSGMETAPQEAAFPLVLFFKSHHSGMETGDILGPHGRKLTLNRTIVGWKHVVSNYPNQPRHALNRTIVGWKRIIASGWKARLIALNRTIVGWKQERKRAKPRSSSALNRTIVGWKPA